MRDPELVARAQRVAAQLERAWDRWRTIHGLATEPVQPAASYVGYSLAEPWGRPRVVIGLDADEAEHLVALLERHECGGGKQAAGELSPLQDGVLSAPADPPEDASPEAAGSHGEVRVPAQIGAGPAGSGPAGPGGAGGPGDIPPGGARAGGSGGARSVVPPGHASPGGSGGVVPPGQQSPREGTVTAGTVAPQAATAESPGVSSIPQLGAAGQWDPDRSRSGGASLVSLGVSPQPGTFVAEAPCPPVPAPQAADGPGDLAHDLSGTIAIELAGWASGELPGQASEQLAAWVAGGAAPAPADPP